MSLEIIQALGLVTVQDLGRPGHMHEGLAPGGALVTRAPVTSRAPSPADSWVARLPSTTGAAMPPRIAR